MDNSILSDVEVIWFIECISSGMNVASSEIIGKRET